MEAGRAVNTFHSRRRARKITAVRGRNGDGKPLPIRGHHLRRQFSRGSPRRPAELGQDEGGRQVSCTNAAEGEDQTSRGTGVPGMEGHAVAQGETIVSPRVDLPSRGRPGGQTPWCLRIITGTRAVIRCWVTNSPRRTRGLGGVDGDDVVDIPAPRTSTRRAAFAYPMAGRALPAAGPAPRQAEDGFSLTVAWG